MSRRSVPYLTMHRPYERAALEVFAAMLEQGIDTGISPGFLFTIEQRQRSQRARGICTRSTHPVRLYSGQLSRRRCNQLLSGSQRPDLGFR